MNLNELFESMNGGKDVDESVADGETFTAAFVMYFAERAIKWANLCEDCKSSGKVEIGEDEYPTCPCNE